MGVCRSSKLMQMVAFCKLRSGLYLIERGWMKPIGLVTFVGYADGTCALKIRIESKQELDWGRLAWFILLSIAILVTATLSFAVTLCMATSFLMIYLPWNLLLLYLVKIRNNLCSFLVVDLLLSD